MVNVLQLDDFNSPELDIYARLTQLTGFKLTRGMLCAMRRRRLSKLQEICSHANTVAVLENVMNPTNVGAIFRSAAALGIDAVILTVDCSNQLYRRAIRVSMGTVFQIPWTILDEETVVDDADEENSQVVAEAVKEANEVTVEITDEEAVWPDKGIKQLSELGFKTAAMSLSDHSVSIDDESLMAEEKLAVILGSEGTGLLQGTIDACDYTVRIPME